MHRGECHAGQRQVKPSGAAARSREPRNKMLPRADGRIASARILIGDAVPVIASRYPSPPRIPCHCERRAAISAGRSHVTYRRSVRFARNDLRVRITNASHRRQSGRLRCAVPGQFCLRQPRPALLRSAYASRNAAPARGTCRGASRQTTAAVRIRTGRISRRRKERCDPG